MSDQIDFKALEKLAQEHDLPMNQQLTSKAQGAKPSSSSKKDVKLPELKSKETQRTRISDSNEDFDPTRITTSQVISSPLPTMTSRNTLFYLLLKKQDHGRATNN
jgi:hypothetical protein